VSWKKERDNDSYVIILLSRYL